MKKFLRKTLALALAATLVLGAGPLAGLCGLELPKLSSLTASAAEEEPVWTVATDDMLIIENNTITGYTDKLSGNIEIPTHINGTAITSIKADAFNGCLLITAIKIPDSIESIGSEAFQNCSNLETIYFNATNCIVNSFSAGSNYENCNNLTKIVFGEDVTVIPENACFGATKLQSVIFNGDVTAIGDSAFNNCPSLRSVDLSDVQTIGNNAFAGCISIPTFTFSDKLETIGSDAFNGCKMTEITIPEKVKLIDTEAFQNCSVLETIYFNATNCSVDTFSAGSNYENCNKFTKIVFGEDVTVIPANVCFGATKLQSVVFEGDVTAIGSYAFDSCSSLKAVDLSEVQKIGNNAFAGCISIPTFTFSDKLETIGSDAFNGCKMTEITIPAKVKSIDTEAFQNCSVLETIYFNATNCSVDTFSAGSNYENCNNLTKFVFGKDVTAIPANACFGATKLQSVVFEGDVTAIGGYAFDSCSSLRAVDLSKVQTIGNNAFAGCISIPSFTFSDKLETIGSDAFNGCKMTEITIPAKVKSIDTEAFQNCSVLETIYFNATNCNVDTYSGGSNYENCNNLTKFVFGKDVTAIPANVCFGAYALETVTINGLVTSIGQNAFKNCTLLNNIHLKAYSEETFDFDSLKIGKGNDVVTEDIFTFGLENKTETNEEYDVTVSYMSTAFDKEVKLSITETVGEREKGSIVISDREISEQIGCFNIKMILADGSSTAAVQPNGKVTVKMAIPANYIGKMNFRIVHRTGNGQRENFATNPKGSEKKLSVSSDGKYWIFEVTSFSDFEFFAVEAVPTVSIKNNSGTKTINYGDVLRLTANTSNMPADAKIFWYVDGVKRGEGTTFEVSPESGSVDVTVKVVDASGNDYADTEISDSQKVTVKSGFFQKLINFFKNLFGISRIVAQRFTVK